MNGTWLTMDTILRAANCQRGQHLPIERAGVQTSFSDRRKMLMPAVDTFPPDEAQPLVEIHFGPLAMLPPTNSELGRVRGGGHVEGKTGSLLLKFTQRAPRVIVGGHD